MTDEQRPRPAVLAEDMRALAEVVPFDAATCRMLEQVADVLDEIDPAQGWAGFLEP